MRKPEKGSKKESGKKVAEEKETKKTAATSKKEDKKAGRPKQLHGRKKGVSFSVKPKIVKQLSEIKESWLNEFEEFEIQFDNFITKGNKSAARKSRKHLMAMQHHAKELRNLIQEGKDTLIETQAS